MVLRRVLLLHILPFTIVTITTVSPVESTLDQQRRARGLPATNHEPNHALARPAPGDATVSCLFELSLTAIVGFAMVMISTLGANLRTEVGGCMPRTWPSND